VWPTGERSGEGDKPEKNVFFPEKNDFLFEWRFWATFCKTVRPMLPDRCLTGLSVCYVGVLWPNGWMDQDETWHGGMPRSRPHCVRWESSSPKGA